jgi:RNA polymerase sigma-70 factor (ECF subfamily)
VSYPRIADERPDRYGDDLPALVAGLKTKVERERAHYRIPREDAEDLLQQVFLAFVQKRQQIDSPEAWLLGAFRRECLMYLRRRQRRLYDAIDTTLLEACCQPAPPDQEHRQLLRDVETAIEKTPSRCRSILRLRYRLGFATEEIAEELGYRTTSVRKIASRCLAALARRVVGAPPALTATASHGELRAR